MLSTPFCVETSSLTVSLTVLQARLQGKQKTHPALHRPFFKIIGGISAPVFISSLSRGLPRRKTWQCGHIQSLESGTVCMTIVLFYLPRFSLSLLLRTMTLFNARGKFTVVNALTQQELARIPRRSTFVMGGTGALFQ